MIINKNNIKGFKIEKKAYCTDCVSIAAIKYKGLKTHQFYHDKVVMGANNMVFCDKCGAYICTGINATKENRENRRKYSYTGLGIGCQN